MNIEGRTKRDREIVDLYLAGNRPAAIGSVYGIDAVRVRRIIHAAGLEVERADGYPNGWGIWDMPESKRREAIWEKQREGARQARMA